MYELVVTMATVVIMAIMVTMATMVTMAIMVTMANMVDVLRDRRIYYCFHLFIELEFPLKMPN